MCSGSFPWLLVWEQVWKSGWGSVSISPMRAWPSVLTIRPATTALIVLGTVNVSVSKQAIAFPNSWTVLRMINTMVINTNERKITKHLVYFLVFSVDWILFQKFNIIWVWLLKNSTRLRENFAQYECLGLHWFSWIFLIMVLKVCLTLTKTWFKRSLYFTRLWKDISS